MLPVLLSVSGSRYSRGLCGGHRPVHRLVPVWLGSQTLHTGSLLQLAGGLALMVVEVLRHDQTLPRKPRSRST
jgi:hypothetical protein